ncbi:MAG: hypothetical protein R3325_07135 [Thermoanaerobaculia bacterium]|nr:hypothetical protein [Thermoanaerobaculia bacterium]
MKSVKLITLAALLLSLAAPAAAQEEGAFTGSFQIGFRTVDVSGSPTKYKEDFNLDDGPRLFRLDIDYIPGDAMRRFADKVQIDVNNFGGDPFETMRLSVEKYGRYDFDYSRRKSDYFYEDVILPVELAGDPAVALAGDFHHFDFSRVHDRGQFKIWISERAKFTFGLDRYTRRGESTTTLDISRDEFELDKPVHESYNAYTGAFEYSWDKVTLVLEQQIRDFENDVDIFLPGRSLGEDPADATTLDFYFFSYPYEYTSNDSIVRLIANPNDKLLVKLQANRQSLELDQTSSESGAGTAFNGSPLAIDSRSVGDIERDLDLYDLDLTYRFNPRWALLVGARSYTLDQNGDVRLDDGVVNRGRWEIDTDVYEIGAQFHVSADVTVAAGVREETRDLDFEWSEDGEGHGERVETDQSGYFANVGWRPAKRCSLNLELEDSSFDNPFALASPTDRQRYKLRGSYGNDRGLTVTGSYAINEVENDLSTWKSDYDQLAVRLNYDRDRLRASLGFSNIDVDRKSDQEITTLPGFGGGAVLPITVFYDADTDIIDARVVYDMDGRWLVGADARQIDNSGSFGLEREDYRLWVEFGLGDYLLHLGYRTIDYDETGFDFDDYDADIGEFSIGYRW